MFSVCVCVFFCLGGGGGGKGSCEKLNPVALQERAVQITCVYVLFRRI